MSTRTATSLGAVFAEALMAKDFPRLESILDADVDFRALTPNRQWEAAGAQRVVADVIRQWLPDGVEVDEPLMVETDDTAGCGRVGYRYRGHDQEGPFIVEQQAYFETSDGHISWMRLVCSGMRTPAPES